MAVRRTRDQKIRAQQRRNVTYDWDDTTRSTPPSLPHDMTVKTPSTAEMQEQHWLRQDLRRTLMATLVIVLLIVVAIWLTR